VIDRNPGKTVIYYQDGKEVAREVIDVEGNLKTTGKIPAEYNSRTKYHKKTDDSRGSSTNKTTPVERNKKPLRSFGGNGEMTIRVNLPTQLGVFDRTGFIKFRKDKINEYGQTNIYASDYDPFTNPHDEIYHSIVFGVNWTDFSQFYVCNPYFLIILSKPTHVIALAEHCGLSEIQYKNGTIEEVYSGSQAAQFFSFVAEEPDLSNAVRLWMVNAQDAELPYIAIDKAKCENIDFTWRDTPENIANCIYTLKACYHVGSYKLNNISPDCPRATLKIKEMNKYTCIYVKLWANKPASKEAKEDLAYVIKVIP
jgi:hypothetical protein